MPAAVRPALLAVAVLALLLPAPADAQAVTQGPFLEPEGSDGDPLLRTGVPAQFTARFEAKPSTPGQCAALAAGDGYRLSAWVASAPPGFDVEVTKAVAAPAASCASDGAVLLDVPLTVTATPEAKGLRFEDILVAARVEPGPGHGASAVAYVPVPVIPAYDGTLAVGLGPVSFDGGTGVAVLTVRNEGNAPTRVHIEVVDDGGLAVRLPDAVVLDRPGGEAWDSADGDGAEARLPIRFAPHWPGEATVRLRLLPAAALVPEAQGEPVPVMLSVDVPASAAAAAHPLPFGTMAVGALAAALLAGLLALRGHARRQAEASGR